MPAPRLLPPALLLLSGVLLLLVGAEPAWSEGVMTPAEANLSCMPETGLARPLVEGGEVGVAYASPVLGNATALGSAQRFGFPLRVHNLSPNPVEIALCANISSCLASRNYGPATGRASHTTTQRASRLECHPHLGVGENASLQFSPGLEFASIRIVFCSANNPSRCFDGDDDAIFTKIIQPPAQPEPSRKDPWVVNSHSIMIPASSNALCIEDSDCPGAAQPICSQSLQRCVNEAQIDGVCTAPCGDQPLVPIPTTHSGQSMNVKSRFNFRCWCHRFSQHNSFVAATSALGLAAYVFLLWWIQRARVLALLSDVWGKRNAILPIYRRVFYFVGAYVLFTVALRIIIDVEERDILQMSRHIGALQITARCLVAFLEETIIEGLIFFFLQNGSGIDQGYRALAGGTICGLIFSTLTALRRTDLPLPPLTSSGSCIGCLLDRESFGYEKPGPGDCWMQLFRDIVYKGSCLVLYLFILGLRAVEKYKESRYFRNINRTCCKSFAYNESFKSDRYPRGNFYRFLLFLICLRLLDMSYMSAQLGPCSSILGYLAWVIWFPIELYILFRSDTAYWKGFIGRMPRRPRNYTRVLQDIARSEMSMHDTATMHSLNHGTQLHDSLLGSDNNSLDHDSDAGFYPQNDESGWLSPAQSHWVQPKALYRDPPTYKYPPTHARKRKSGFRSRHHSNQSASQMYGRLSINSGLRNDKPLRSHSIMERPHPEKFDEASAALRLERIFAMTSTYTNSQTNVITWNDLDSRRMARRAQRHRDHSSGQSARASASVKAPESMAKKDGPKNGKAALPMLSSASVGPYIMYSSNKNDLKHSDRDVVQEGSASHLNGAESLSESKENSNRVSIPPVEKITIDFSAVNVLRNHLLDAGSTAKVYEGRFGKERVAVKLCRLRTLNQKSVADFVREARTLAAFSHPNVMRLVGCCPVPPHFMIVSEYCSRGNLAKVLHSKESLSLTWQKRLFLALGAAKGIAHVHSKGFMHGDIKPDNFIVTEEWIVKISDFGEASQQKNGDSAADAVKAARAKAAQAKDSENAHDATLDISSDAILPDSIQDDFGTSNGIVGGTIAWLAPERLAPIYKLFLDLEPEGSNTARRKKEWAKYGSGLTKAADVYSFSLVVWEIFTGKRPFAGMDSFEIGLAVLKDGMRPVLIDDSNDSPGILGTIPGMKSMLRASWAGNPSLRPDMRQLCQEIAVAYEKR